MLLLQEAAHAAQSAAEGAHGAAFHPTLPWLIVLLPFLGFVANGLLSVIAARRALPALPPVGDPSYDHHDAHAAAPALAHPGAAPSEQEGHDVGTRPNPVDHAHDHGHDAHAHDDHGHDAHAPAGPRPFTHTLPSLIAPGVMLLAFLLAAYNLFEMIGFRAGVEHPVFEAVRLWSWMPVGDLRIDASLLLDPLSMVMTLIITGVGFLIHVFSVGYMKEDPGYPRYMAYLNLFVSFMLVLVLGASYPVMFVGWEGVGLCSYLLIGFWFTEKANADAGKKAFIVNRIGDFGFLMGMFLLFWNVGALDFAGVNDTLVSGRVLDYNGAVVTWIALFFFLGACGKSAQIPLFVWLPDAMAGPTPVSALIHAATMVTAGVYLVARSSVIYTMAPVASLVVAVVGALTAIFAATIGLKQWDIKKVLAYSTVSQLGFMFAAVGMGAYVSGVFHLMTHAFFKACLFLGSGAVIHAMHHALHATHNPADAQDMRNMGGLRKYLPVTFVTMGIATLAIAGIPPFAGFFSKDEIIGAALTGAEGHNAIGLSTATLFGIRGSAWMWFIWGTLSIAAFMTAFYMGRMMIYTFFGPNRTGEEERKHLRFEPATFTVVLVALAALSTVGGMVNVEDDVPVVNAFNVDGKGAALHEWLHPALMGSDSVVKTYALAAPREHAASGSEGATPAEAPPPAWPIVLAVLIGAAGLALAWLRIRPAAGRIGVATEEPAYRSAAGRILYNKWYVDELYDRVVVRPVKWASRRFADFDMGVIDWTIDLFGRLAQQFGLAFGRLQTGQLNTYAFVLVVGVLLVLGGFVAAL